MGNVQFVIPILMNAAAVKPANQTRKKNKLVRSQVQLGNDLKKNESIEKEFPNNFHSFGITKSIMGR